MKKTIFISSTLPALLSCQRGTEKQVTGKAAKGRELLGIFGGMGPEATSDLFASIIRETQVSTDKEHIPTLVYSLPRVPDRMSSIENNDPAIKHYHLLRW